MKLNKAYKTDQFFKFNQFFQILEQSSNLLE